MFNGFLCRKKDHARNRKIEEKKISLVNEIYIINTVNQPLKNLIKRNKDKSSKINITKINGDTQNKKI